MSSLTYRKCCIASIKRECLEFIGHEHFHFLKCFSLLCLLIIHQKWEWNWICQYDTHMKRRFRGPTWTIIIFTGCWDDGKSLWSPHRCGVHKAQIDWLCRRGSDDLHPLPPSASQPSPQFKHFNIPSQPSLPPGPRSPPGPGWLHRSFSLVAGIRP